jgi:hypothetical protein
MRSMTRWTMAGCMALAALGSVAVLDVGSRAAEAAPSVSRFAGTYVGPVPGFTSSVSWTVTISDGGRITSSYSSGKYKRSVSGRVGSDGSYSITVSETSATFDDPERNHHGPAYVTTSYESTGNLALDADGDIVGTADTGESFVWLLQ